MLHVCCAPCSTAVIERLAERFQLTLFFYNPNIHPLSEYAKRVEEIQRYARITKLPLLLGPDRQKQWVQIVKAQRWATERSQLRCQFCYTDRLQMTAEVARQRGNQWFTTTLSISPHKPFQLLQKIGQKAGEQTGVRFLAEDFKKQDGFKRSVCLAENHELYRQDYCGCVYSMLERRRQKPYNQK